MLPCSIYILINNIIFKSYLVARIEKFAIKFGQIPTLTYRIPNLVYNKPTL